METGFFSAPKVGQAPSSRSPRVQKSSLTKDNSNSFVSTFEGGKSTTSPTKLSDFHVGEDTEIFWANLLLKLKMANTFKAQSSIRIPDSVFHASSLWLFTDDAQRLCIRRQFSGADIIGKLTNSAAVRLQEQSMIPSDRIISAVVIGSDGEWSSTRRHILKDELEAAYSSLASNSNCFIQGYVVPLGATGEVVGVKYEAALPTSNHEHSLRNAASSASVKFYQILANGTRSSLPHDDETSKSILASIRELIQYVWLEQHCFVTHLTVEFIVDLAGTIWVSNVPSIRGKQVIPKFGTIEPLFHESGTQVAAVARRVAVCQECGSDNLLNTKMCWNCGHSYSASADLDNASITDPSVVTAAENSSVAENRHKILPKPEDVDRWYLDQCLFCYSDNFLDQATLSPREDLLGAFESSVRMNSSANLGGEEHDVSPLCEDVRDKDMAGFKLFHWGDILPMLNGLRISNMLSCVVRTGVKDEPFRSFQVLNFVVSSRSVTASASTVRKLFESGNPARLFVASSDGLLESMLSLDEYLSMLSTNAGAVWGQGRLFLLDIPFVAGKKASFEMRSCSYINGAYQEFSRTCHVNNTGKIVSSERISVEPSQRCKQLLSSLIEGLETSQAIRIKCISVEVVVTAKGYCWLACVPELIVNPEFAPASTSLFSASLNVNPKFEWLSLLDSIALDGGVRLPVVNCIIRANDQVCVGYRTLSSGNVSKAIIRSLTEARDQSDSEIWTVALDFSCGKALSTDEFWKPYLNSENSINLLPQNICIITSLQKDIRFLRVIYANETVVAHWAKEVFTEDLAAETFVLTGDWSKLWGQVKGSISQIKQFALRRGQILCNLEMFFAVDSLRNAQIIFASSLRCVPKMNSEKPMAISRLKAWNSLSSRSNYVDYCTMHKVKMVWSSLLESVLSGIALPVPMLSFALHKQLSGNEQDAVVLFFESSEQDDGYHVIQSFNMSAVGIEAFLNRMLSDRDPVAAMMSAVGDPVLVMNRADLQKSVQSQLRGPWIDDDFAVQQLRFNEGTGSVFQITCDVSCIPSLDSSNTSLDEQSTLECCFSIQLFVVSSGSKLVVVDRRYSDFTGFYLEVFPFDSRMRQSQLMKETVLILIKAVRSRLNMVTRSMQAKFYIGGDGSIHLANCVFMIAEHRKLAAKPHYRDSLEGQSIVTTNQESVSDMSLPSLFGAQQNNNSSNERKVGGVVPPVVMPAVTTATVPAKQVVAVTSSDNFVAKEFAGQSSLASKIAATGFGNASSVPMVAAAERSNLLDSHSKISKSDVASAGVSEYKSCEIVLPTIISEEEEAAILADSMREIQALPIILPPKPSKALETRNSAGCAEDKDAILQLPALRDTEKPVGGKDAVTNKNAVSHDATQSQPLVNDSLAARQQHEVVPREGDGGTTKIGRPTTQENTVRVSTASKITFIESTPQSARDLSQSNGRGGSEPNFEGLSETSLKRLLTASIHQRAEIRMALVDMASLILRIQLTMPVPILSTLWFEKSSLEWSLLFTDKDGQLHKKRVTPQYIKEKVFSKQTAKSAKSAKSIDDSKICRLSMYADVLDALSLEFTALNLTQSVAVISNDNVSQLSSVAQSIEDVDGFKGFLQVIVERDDNYFLFKCDCLTPGTTSSAVYNILDLRSAATVSEIERARASKSILSSSAGEALKEFAEMIVMNFNFQAKMMLKSLEIVYAMTKNDKPCVITMRCSCVSLEDGVDFDSAGKGGEGDSFVALSVGKQSAGPRTPVRDTDALAKPIEFQDSNQPQNQMEPIERATVPIEAKFTPATPATVIIATTPSTAPSVRSPSSPRVDTSDSESLQSKSRKLKARPSFKERLPTHNPTLNALVKAYHLAEIIFLIATNEIPLSNILMSIFPTADGKFILYFAGNAGLLRQKSSVDYEYVHNKIKNLYDKHGGNVVFIDVCRLDGSLEQVTLAECRQLATDPKFVETGSFLQLRSSSDQRWCFEVNCKVPGSSVDIASSLKIRNRQGQFEDPSEQLVQETITAACKSELLALVLTMIDSFSSKLQIQLCRLVVDFYPSKSSSSSISSLHFESTETVATSAVSPSRTANPEPVVASSTLAIGKIEKTVMTRVDAELAENSIDGISVSSFDNNSVASSESNTGSNTPRRRKSQKPRPTISEKTVSPLGNKLLEMAEIMYLLSSNSIDTGRVYMSVFPAMDAGKFILYFAGTAGKLRQKSNVDVAYVESKISALLAKSSSANTVSIELWGSSGTVEQLAPDQYKLRIASTEFRQNGCYIQVRSTGDKRWLCEMSCESGSLSTRKAKFSPHVAIANDVESSSLSESTRTTVVSALDNFVAKFAEQLKMNLIKLSVAFYTTKEENPTITYMRFECIDMSNVIVPIVEADSSPSAKPKSMLLSSVSQFWTTPEVIDGRIVQVLKLSDVLFYLASFNIQLIPCALSVFPTDSRNNYNIYFSTGNLIRQKLGVSGDYIVDKLTGVCANPNLALLEICQSGGVREATNLAGCKDKMEHDGFVGSKAHLQVRLPRHQRYFCQCSVSSDMLFDFRALYLLSPNDELTQITSSFKYDKVKITLTSCFDRICKYFCAKDGLQAREIYVEILSDDELSTIAIGNMQVVATPDAAGRPATASITRVPTAPPRNIQSAESDILATVNSSNQSNRRLKLKPYNAEAGKNDLSRNINTAEFLSLLCESEIRIGRCCMSIFPAAEENKFILYLTTATEIIRQKVASCEFILKQLSGLWEKVKDNATISLCTDEIGSVVPVAIQDCGSCLNQPSFREQGQFLQLRLSKGQRFTCEVLCASAGSTNVMSLGYSQRLNDGSVRTLSVAQRTELLPNAVQLNVRDMATTIVKELKEKHNANLRKFLFDFYVGEQEKPILAYFAGTYVDRDLGAEMTMDTSSVQRNNSDVRSVDSAGSNSSSSSDNKRPLFLHLPPTKMEDGLFVQHMELIEILSLMTGPALSIAFGRLFTTIAPSIQKGKFILFVCDENLVVRKKTVNKEFILSQVEKMKIKFGKVNLFVDIFTSEGQFESIEIEELSIRLGEDRFSDTGCFVQLRSSQSQRFLCEISFDPESSSLHTYKHFICGKIPGLLLSTQLPPEVQSALVAASDFVFSEFLNQLQIKLLHLNIEYYLTSNNEIVVSLIRSDHVIDVNTAQQIDTPVEVTRRLSSKLQSQRQLSWTGSDSIPVVEFSRKESPIFKSTADTRDSNKALSSSTDGPITTTKVATSQPLPEVEAAIYNLQMEDILRLLSRNKLKIGNVLMTVCAASEAGKFILYVTTAENVIRQKTAQLDYLMNQLKAISQSTAAMVLEVWQPSGCMSEVALNACEAVLTSEAFSKSSYFLQMRTVSGSRVTCECKCTDINTASSSSFKYLVRDLKNGLLSAADVQLMNEPAVKSCIPPLELTIMQFIDEIRTKLNIRCSRLTVDVICTADGFAVSCVCGRKFDAGELFRRCVPAATNSSEEAMKTEFVAITGSVAAPLNDENLSPYLQKIQCPVLEADVPLLLKALDINRDGTVSCADFIAFFTPPAPTENQSTSKLDGMSSIASAPALTKTTSSRNSIASSGLLQSQGGIITMKTFIAVVAEKALTVNAFFMTIFAYDTDRYVLYLPSANGNLVPRFGSGEYMGKQVIKLLTKVGESSIDIMVHEKDFSLKKVRLEDCSATILGLDCSPVGSFMFLRSSKSLKSERWTVTINYETVPPSYVGKLHVRNIDGTTTVSDSASIALPPTAVLNDLAVSVGKIVNAANSSTTSLRTSSLQVDFYLEDGNTWKISHMQSLPSAPASTMQSPAADSKSTAVVKGTNAGTNAVAGAGNGTLVPLSTKSADELTDASDESPVKTPKKLKAKPSFKLNAPVPHSELEHCRHVEMGEMLHAISISKIKFGRFYMSVFAADSKIEEFIMYLATESGIIRQKSVTLDFILSKITAYCEDQKRQNVTVSLRLYHSMGVCESITSDDCRTVLLKPSFKDYGSYLQLQSVGDHKWTCEMVIDPPGSSNVKMRFCDAVPVSNTNSRSVPPSEADLKLLETTFSSIVSEFSLKANWKMKSLRVDFFTEGNSFTNPMIAYMHSEVIEQSTVAEQPSVSSSALEPIAEAIQPIYSAVKSPPLAVDARSTNSAFNMKSISTQELVNLMHTNQIPFPNCPMMIFPTQRGSFTICFANDSLIRRKANVDAEYIMTKITGLMLKSTETCVECCFADGRYKSLTIDECKELLAAAGSENRSDGLFLHVRPFGGSRVVCVLGESDDSNHSKVPKFFGRMEDGALSESIKPLQTITKNQIASLVLSIQQGLESKVKLTLSKLVVDVYVDKDDITMLAAFLGGESRLGISTLATPAKTPTGRATMMSPSSQMSPLSPKSPQRATMMSPMTLRSPPASAIPSGVDPSTSLPKVIHVSLSRLFQQKYRCPMPSWFPCESLPPFQLNGDSTSSSEMYEREIWFVEVLFVLTVTKVEFGKLPVTIVCQSNASTPAEARTFAMFVSAGSNKLKSKADVDIDTVMKQLASQSGKTFSNDEQNGDQAIADLINSDGSRQPVTLKECKQVLLNDRLSKSGASLQLRSFKAERLLVCTCRTTAPAVGSAAAAISLFFAERSLTDGSCKPLSSEEISKLISSATEESLRVTMNRIISEVKGTWDMTVRHIEADFLSRTKDGNADLMFLCLRFREVVQIEDVDALKSLSKEKSNPSSPSAPRQPSSQMPAPSQVGTVQSSVKLKAKAGSSEVNNDGAEDNSQWTEQADASLGSQTEDTVSNSEASDGDNDAGFKNRLSFRRLMLIAVKSQVPLVFKVVPTIFFIRDNPYNAMIRSNAKTGIDRGSATGNSLERFQDETACDFRITNSKQFSSYIGKAAGQELLDNRESSKRKSFDYLQVVPRRTDDRVDLVCKVTVTRSADNTYASSEFTFAFGIRTCTTGVVQYFDDKDVDNTNPFSNMISKDVEKSMTEASRSIAIAFNAQANIALATLVVDFIVINPDTGVINITCVTGVGQNSGGSGAGAAAAASSSRKKTKTSTTQSSKLASINDNDDDDQEQSVRINFSSVLNALSSKKTTIPEGVSIPFTCISSGDIEGDGAPISCFQSNSSHGMNKKKGVTVQTALDKLLSTIGINMSSLSTLGVTVQLATHFTPTGQRKDVTAGALLRLLDNKEAMNGFIKQEEYLQVGYSVPPPVCWACELSRDVNGGDSVLFGQFGSGTDTDRTFRAVGSANQTTLSKQLQDLMMNFALVTRQSLEGRGGLVCKRVVVEFDISSADIKDGGGIKLCFASAVATAAASSESVPNSPLKSPLVVATAVGSPPPSDSAASMKSPVASGAGVGRTSRSTIVAAAGGSPRRPVENQGSTESIAASRKTKDVASPTRQQQQASEPSSSAPKKVEFTDILRSMSSKPAELGASLPACMRMDSRTQTLQLFRSDANNCVAVTKQFQASKLVQQVAELVVSDPSIPVAYLYKLGGNRKPFTKEECLSFLAGDMQQQLNERYTYLALKPQDSEAMSYFCKCSFGAEGSRPQLQISPRSDDGDFPTTLVKTSVDKSVKAKAARALETFVRTLREGFNLTISTVNAELCVGGGDSCYFLYVVVELVVNM